MLPKSISPRRLYAHEYRAYAVMKRFRKLSGLITYWLLASVVLSACTSMGSRTVPRDRFNYNAAIAQSTNEQMLLNIIRLRYLEIPGFLAVNSVITNYSYDGSVGINKTRADGNSDVVPDTLRGIANLAYAERPTITYSPLAGQDFSRRMLKPIPVEMIFSLSQAGWPVDILLSIALQRINNVENMGFGQVSAPGDLDRKQQFAEEERKLERYQRVLQLMLLLGRAGAIEVQRKEGDESVSPYLHFASDLSPDIQRLIDELKQVLDLSPEQDTFRITGRMTGRKADEITIQPRSLLAIMSYLSRGTDIPTKDKLNNRVVVLPEATEQKILKQMPLRIRSQKERPDDPYVAVRYREYWFYIDHADIKSKRTFATMQVLFQLQAPSGGTAAPLLTLPTGGR